MSKKLDNFSAAEERTFLSHYCGKNITVFGVYNVVIRGILALSRNSHLFPALWPNTVLKEKSAVLRLDKLNNKDTDCYESIFEYYDDSEELVFSDYVWLREIKLTGKFDKDLSIAPQLLVGVKIDNILQIDFLFETLLDSSLLTDSDVTFRTVGNINNLRNLVSFNLLTHEVQDQSLDDINDNYDWDQYDYNKKHYGLISSYKEEFYTTALDISSCSQHDISEAIKFQKFIGLGGKSKEDSKLTRNTKKQIQNKKYTGKLDKFEELSGDVKQLNQLSNKKSTQYKPINVAGISRYLSSIQKSSNYNTSDNKNKKLVTSANKLFNIVTATMKNFQNCSIYNTSDWSCYGIQELM